MSKIIKAWAIVDENGLLWSEVEPVNGKYGSALTKPWISTNKEFLRENALESGEEIIKVNITY